MKLSVFLASSKTYCEGPLTFDRFAQDVLDIDSNGGSRADSSSRSWTTIADEMMLKKES